jgi:hypothetical protein
VPSQIAAGLLVLPWFWSKVSWLAFETTADDLPWQSLDEPLLSLRKSLSWMKSSVDLRLSGMPLPAGPAMNTPWTVAPVESLRSISIWSPSSRSMPIWPPVKVLE